MALPRKVGPFTLMRRLDTDGVAESFAAILDQPAGKPVIVHRLLPWVTKDLTRLQPVEARIQDLTGIRHPGLVAVTDYAVHGEDRLIVAESSDAIDLARVLKRCRDQGAPMPHNIFLHIATQICNSLEALHGRPGKATGAENVLHMGLKPQSILLASDGKLLLTGYGLVRSPTGLPNTSVSESGGYVPAVEYLSPEQTQPDQKLFPASDIFALGALLYEMLTLESLFRAESSLQTIHRVRRAEVTTPLLRVKEQFPGLDKVLYRALSLNPKHRYQRAFVLREDLRGLMSGYSFANIAEEMRAFLAPFTNAPQPLAGPSLVPPPADDPETNSLIDGLRAHPPAGDDTASLIRKAQERGQTIVPPSSIAPVEEDPPTAPRPSPAPPAEDPHTGWQRIPTPDRRAFDDELMTQPKASATPAPAPVKAAAAPPPAPAPAAPPGRLASRTPLPPPARTPVPAARPQDPVAQPSPSASQPPQNASVSLDEDDLPQRGSSLTTGVMVGGAVGAVVVVLVGLFVCAGIGGGAALLGGSAATAPSAPAVPGTPDLAVATPPSIPSTPPTPSTPSAPSTPATPTDTTPSTAPSTLASSPIAADPTPRVEDTPPPQVFRPDPPPRTTPTTSGGTSSASGGHTSTGTTTARTTNPSGTTSGTTTARTTPRTAPFDLSPPPVTPSDDAALIATIDAPPVAGPLGDYSARAHMGKLTDDDRVALQAMKKDNPEYGRSRVLLYEDAKARGDASGRKTYLDAVMDIPENQYNPALLAEQSQLLIERGDWRMALDRANLAERQWQRLPPDLVFSRKAMIYECQAAAYQGLFYASDGEDLDSLDQAVRAWEKYKRHVDAKSRLDLSMKADDQLAKLTDMQRRLE